MAVVIDVQGKFDPDREASETDLTNGFTIIFDAESSSDFFVIAFEILENIVNEYNSEFSVRDNETMFAFTVPSLPAQGFIEVAEFLSAVSGDVLWIFDWTSI